MESCTPMDLFKSLYKEERAFIASCYKRLYAVKLKYKEKGKTFKYQYDEIVRIIRKDIKDSYKDLSYTICNNSKDRNNLLFKLCKDICTYLNEFSEAFGTEWDLVDGEIVVHFPEVEVKKHIITDIWVKFPILFESVSQVRFRRTRYSLSEYLKGFCHPHIQFVANLDWSHGFCMGSTPFRASSRTSPSLNILSFLYYLNDFLRHQHSTNPYINVDNVDKTTSEYPLYRATFKYDLDEIDIKLSTIYDNKVVSPMYTEKTKQYLFNNYRDAFVWNIDGKIYTTKGMGRDFTLPPNPFQFKGKTIENKIINVELDENLLVINKYFYNNWNNYVTNELTAKFKEFWKNKSMEAICINNRESVKEMSVSL